MKIWIDADACPRIIKEIILRASVRLDIPVCLVANQNLSKSNSHLVSNVVVAGGFDAADDYKRKIIKDNVLKCKMPSEFPSYIYANFPL